MFSLTSIDNGDLLGIIQLLCVLVGFYFSIKSLRATQISAEIATNVAQAQLHLQIAAAGRELQIELLKLSAQGTAPSLSQSDLQKFAGIVTSYYAANFELDRIFKMPDHVTTLLRADFRQLLQQDDFRIYFEHLRGNYSDQFNEYASKLRGVST